MIIIDLLYSNFQLSVTSSSWMNLLCLFIEPSMNRLGHLPANFQMTAKSSSDTPAVETTSEYNSPPKLSHAIIFFCMFLIISLENISLFQLTVVELVFRQVPVLPLSFLLELLTGLNMVIDPFTLHRSILLFTVQFYIISLPYQFLCRPPFISLKPS